MRRSWLTGRLLTGWLLMFLLSLSQAQCVPWTNQDVVDLIRSGLSSGVVSARLRAVPCVHFDLSVAALKGLRKQGVPPSVLITMIESQQRQDKADEAARTAAPAQPVPAVWSPAELDRAGRRALLSIEAWDETGKQISVRNGFWVTPEGLILSFGAVDASVHSLRVRSAEGDVFDQVAVVDIDPRRNLSVLRVKTSEMPALTVVPLGEITAGMPVALIEGVKGEAELLNGIAEAQVDASQVTGAGAGYHLIPVKIEGTQNPAPVPGRPVLNQQGQLIAIASPYVWKGEPVVVPVEEIRGILRDRLGRMLARAWPAAPAAPIAPSAPPDPMKLLQQARSVYVLDRTRSGLDARAENELNKKRRWQIVDDADQADLWLVVEASGKGWERTETLEVYDRQSHTLVWSGGDHVAPMRRSAVRRLIDRFLKAIPPAR